MRAGAVILALLALLVLRSAIFVVNEYEQVIVTQFGEPVGDPIDTPGLHFKVPMVQVVHRFDKRFLEWEGDVAELPTKDKVFILVDTYARWRISDPLLFFQRLRNEQGGQSRLDDVLDGETRNAIAKHELLEVIRSTNREAESSETTADPQTALESIDIGREEIRLEVLKAAQPRTADLGIEILDLQFKRINYGRQVLDDVYDRMTSERVRISDRFRSEGQGEAAEIRGRMERDYQRIQSEAYRKAEEIRGRSDAEATEIYARAYNQSQDSRRFYEFLKSMETLESTVDADTRLLLSTDSDFYRFLEGSGQ
jgi:membrane protease subunit HflC